MSVKEYDKSNMQLKSQIKKKIAGLLGIPVLATLYMLCSLEELVSTNASFMSKRVPLLVQIVRLPGKDWGFSLSHLHWGSHTRAMHLLMHVMHFHAVRKGKYRINEKHCKMKWRQTYFSKTGSTHDLMKVDPNIMQNIAYSYLIYA